MQVKDISESLTDEQINSIGNLLCISFIPTWNSEIIEKRALNLSEMAYDNLWRIN